MTDRYLHLDSQHVKAELAKLRAKYPELDEDPEFAAEVFEAETDVTRILERAVTQTLDAEAMAEAVGIRMKQMSVRAGRFFMKAEAMRSLAKGIMRAAGLTDMRLTEATLSIIKARQTVSVTDLEAIPQGYVRVKREADKTAIKAAWDAGNEIPGTALVLGSEGLRIQPK